MKNLMCFLCITFGIVYSASASGNTGTAGTKGTTTETKKKEAVAELKNTVLAKQRASHLSDQMIRELRLNNYQSKKVREINLDKAAQMMAIEMQYAGNQKLIDQKCKEVCAERDLELESVLSTVQYNDYFGDRQMYNKSDREFVASIGQQEDNRAATVAQTEAAPSIN